MLTIRERFVIFLSETVIITVKETRQTNVIKFIKEKEITIMAKLYVLYVVMFMKEISHRRSVHSVELAQRSSSDREMTRLGLLSTL